MSIICLKVIRFLDNTQLIWETHVLPLAEPAFVRTVLHSGNNILPNDVLSPTGDGSSRNIHRHW